MGAIRLATSANTDEEYGGTFATQASEVAYNNTSSGLTADDAQEAIDELNGKIGLKVNKANTTGTTTNSGAIGIPSAHIGKVISANYASDSSQANGLIFVRDNSYFTCRDNDLQVVANKSVSIDYYYAT